MYRQIPGARLASSSAAEMSDNFITEGAEALSHREEINESAYKIGLPL
jgi:hypothetical protein